MFSVTQQMIIIFANVFDDILDKASVASLEVFIHVSEKSHQFGYA
jgi:hypothetical protein